MTGNPSIKEVCWSSSTANVDETVFMEAKLSQAVLKNLNIEFIVCEYSGIPPQQGGGSRETEIEIIKTLVEKGNSIAKSPWKVKLVADNSGEGMPEYRFKARIDPSSVGVASKLLKIGEIDQVIANQIGNNGLELEVSGSGLNGFIADFSVKKTSDSNISEILYSTSAPFSNGRAKAVWNFGFLPENSKVFFDVKLKHTSSNVQITSSKYKSSTIILGSSMEPAPETSMGSLLNPININIEKPKITASEKIEKIDFQRTKEESILWNEVTKSIANSLKFNKNGVIDGNLSKLGFRIESNFKFEIQNNDVDFIFFHVEPLLEQAADLLDRGVRDRVTWDEQATKMYLLGLELNEYNDLDIIHREEEAAGFYDIDSKQSYAQFKAEEFNVEWQKYLQTKAEKIGSDFFSDENIRDQTFASMLSAWIGGRISYLENSQNSDQYKYILYKWDNNEKSVSQHSKEAAMTQAHHSLYLQKNSGDLQADVYQSNKGISELLVPGHKAKSDWDSLNSNFRRRRTMIARKYQDIKSKAATDSEGLLNYGKRLVSLQNRFHADFRSAVARLKSIEKGMTEIYDYINPLPKNENSVDYFDDCLLWARETIQWLIRFSRAEQSLVLPISLRDILGEKIWASRIEQGLLDFNLSESLFPDMRHIRLRGISAYISQGNAHDKIWQCVISAPTSGLVRYLSEKSLEIDQSEIPTCKLFRISDRNSQREPDICGMSSLYNISPIGNWKINLIGSVPKSQDLSSITDIQFDFHLVYRSKKSI